MIKSRLALGVSMFMVAMAADLAIAYWWLTFGPIPEGAFTFD